MAATVSLATHIWTVEFDRVLRATTSLNPAFWAGVANLGTGVRVWNPTAPPVASGIFVSFPSFDAGPSFGGPSVAYTAFPADLFGRSGLPVANFGNFPAVIIP